MTRRSLLTLLACLLAGCGASHTAARSTTSAKASRAMTTSTGRGGTAAAAQKFAEAYVRFLDGAGTANGLPDATSSVRALASRAGPVPAVRRRGMLLITQLRHAVGATGTYLLSARDDAHAFYAQITLAERHGQWVVIHLAPPDFVQVLEPAGPAPPTPPRGSAQAEDAARLFLRGYLPWLYGQAPFRPITDASDELLADLKAHSPRAPPTMQSLAPKVAAIAMQRHGLGGQALSNISDGRETYELVLSVAQTGGQWIVNNVTSPR